MLVILDLIIIFRYFSIFILDCDMLKLHLRFSLSKILINRKIILHLLFYLYLLDLVFFYCILQLFKNLSIEIPLIFIHTHQILMHPFIILIHLFTLKKSIIIILFFLNYLDSLNLFLKINFSSFHLKFLSLLPSHKNLLLSIKH